MERFSEQSLRPAIENLERMFSILNTEFFCGKLEKPVITISPDTTRGAYGWCSASRIWQDAENPNESPEAEPAKRGYHEINLCAEHITRPLEAIAETMLHEMVHLYNIKEGVKDTSRGGFYHNKAFRDAAESHGLTVQKTAKYGYSETSLSATAAEFAKEAFRDMTFEIYRVGGISGTKKARRATYKYICSCCGENLRSAKKLHLVCGDCEVPFETLEE